VSDPKFWKLNWNSEFGLGPWLGGYQSDKLAEPDGHWTWDSGEAWDYTNWAPVEPNNLYSAEDHLHLFGYYALMGTQWNDLAAVPQVYQSEEAIMGYVVEWNQVPEPSSLTFLGISVVFLSAHIRQRHKNKKQKV